LSQADVPTSVDQKNKRWSIFKYLPAGNSGGRPGEVTPPQSSSENETMSGMDQNGMNGNGSMSAPSGARLGYPGLPSNTPPYESFSFRFNLEWVPRPVFPSKNLELRTPRLPSAADRLLDRQFERQTDVYPIEPKNISEASLRYAGRALAEWAKIVDECNNFFERRRDEGVPMDKLVETPLLVADTFATPR